MGERLSEPQPVLDLLQKNSGLVLLGDPGSGKTTFLKSLALALASGQEEIPGLGRRLPVLVPLSAYANAIAKRDLPLQDFFSRYFEDRGLELPITPLLTEKLARGEVLAAARRARRGAGVEASQPGGRARPGLLQPPSWSRQQVRADEPRGGLPGGAPDSRRLWRRPPWWISMTRRSRPSSRNGRSAIEKAAAGETRTAREEASREREELLAAVRGNPGVRSLAANPLLLTILALMKRQGVTLPERRVELYQRYVETLIKHWNLARGLAGRPAKDLDLMDTLRVLQPLALWMHETSPGVGLVKEGDLHRELQRIFAERKRTGPREGGAPVPGGRAGAHEPPPRPGWPAVRIHPSHLPGVSGGGGTGSERAAGGGADRGGPGVPCRGSSLAGGEPVDAGLPGSRAATGSGGRRGPRRAVAAIPGSSRGGGDPGRRSGGGYGARCHCERVPRKNRRGPPSDDARRSARESEPAVAAAGAGRAGRPPVRPGSLVVPKEPDLGFVEIPSGSVSDGERPEGGSK